MAHLFSSPVNSLSFLWVPVPVFGYRAAGRMDISQPYCMDSTVPQPYVYAGAVSVPLENGHIPVPIWPQPARHMSPIQLCTVGIAFYILTKFQNKNKRTRENKNQVTSLRGSPENIERINGITEVTVAAYMGKTWNFSCRCTLFPAGLIVDGTALAAVRSGCAANSDSSLSAGSCHSFSSSSSDLATAEASLQQRARSSRVPPPSVLQPPCRPSESLHLPRDRGSTHTLSRTQAVSRALAIAGETEIWPRVGRASRGGVHLLCVHF